MAIQAVRSYEQTVKRLASRVFHHSAGGSYTPWSDVNLSDVAYIYGMSADAVLNDIKQEVSNITKRVYADMII